jgi:hypothetical protein
VIERTGYYGSFHMVGQWFPKIARLEPDGRWAHFPFYHLTEFYSDFGSYDVTLDVPDGYVVGATGTRSSEKSAAGRTIVRYTQSDVHDFAWTAWDRFREKKQQTDGVTVRCLYPPGYEAVANRELDTVAFGIRSFGKAYGRYPYPVLTVVHPPDGADEAGGMEYPTLITTGGSWYSPPWVHEIELVTLHEFGHQYFYGLVATNELAWPFLDEGLNSYAEQLGLSEMFGEGSSGAGFGIAISDSAVQHALAAQLGHNEPVAQSASSFATGNDYGAIVYARTAVIFETLARVYGRAAMDRALGEYTRRYRFDHPGIDELLACVRSNIGDAAADAAATLLRDRAWVDYVAANATSHESAEPAGVFDRNGARETASGTSTGSDWEGWALIVRRGTVKLPVSIELRSADGSVQRTTWDGAGNWVRVPYHGKSELVSIVVDPDRNVLVDDNLSNNAYRVGRRARAPRLFERLTYLAELALAWMMP